ncbi:UDP-N-acetylmuramate--L-alanine ligase [Sanguibacter sp. HDW7]|uniref:UDP-N-acetylmuramate--L-alanine ligase n=1 Tax=Sanguibacter sp. HDW7 TaxID=2714931 RepID=UPI00140BA528|nr:UDP-N-acetylmuramate--L-alanine ligase [Sanguibacter sp. HDW7]QIK83312.1 UDP-N-acetylmuramate--L-alanine ligase [Sanguibacter sp. HDW7]
MTAVPLALAELGRTHLVGIGGAGVSVVAQLLAARGVPVQGSDAHASDVVDALRAEGLTVWVGHDAAHVADADTLVVSTAVRETNPELAAARERGLRVLHRSEALALLMDGTRAVAVAGAHGKTTTSAMIAVVLGEAGRDPSFAIGGSVRTHAGAVPGGHLGAGDVLVAEADESDGSFLNYRPEIAVVTNVEPDHLDHYGTREAFEAAFVEFAARIRPEGLLVACGDDPGAAALVRAHRATGGTALTYGGPGSDVVVRDHVADGDGGRFTLDVPAATGLVPADRTLDVVLEVPGLHNALDAAAALVTAMRLGVDADTAVAGVGRFLGTGRRFEERGTAGGVRVVDDYAHHPTEVAALLRAARPAAAGGRVLVLFQPHLFSRTRTFAREFADALALADEVVVTDVYAAREDDDPTVTGATITDLMGGRGRHVAGRVAAAHAVAALARPGDLVLTVGAGDVTQLAPVLLESLVARS